MPTIADTFGEELTRRSYTDSAQRVVRHIMERAIDRGMIAGELSDATAGMLAVLSIVRWERKVARAALECLGVDLHRFSQSLDRQIDIEGASTRHSAGPQVITTSSGQRGLVLDLQTPVTALLRRAEEESRLLQHNWVGDEHLLLAAVSLACPRFRAVLDESQLTHDSLRDAIVQLLNT